MTNHPRTIIDKIWEQHVVDEPSDGTFLLYIDRILLHDRSGVLALRSLRDDGREILDAEWFSGPWTT